MKCAEGHDQLHGGYLLGVRNQCSECHICDLTDVVEAGKVLAESYYENEWQGVSDWEEHPAAKPLIEFRRKYAALKDREGRGPNSTV